MRSQAVTDPTPAQAKIETAVGTLLMLSPFWVSALQTVSLVASAIAAVCGAILAVHGVCRLVKRRVRQ